MMARDGKGLLMLPFENYAYGSLDVVHEMITDPATVLGVADGGAHVGVICDASSPTSLLTLWGRDRTRGPKLPLEFLVAKQTRGTAEAYGLLDRGLLAPGHKADINVIDFDALALKRPEVVYDLPAGGRRLIQRASGYRHTFNAGVETVQNDELTGERPGRLVRGAQVAGSDRHVTAHGLGIEGLARARHHDLAAVHHGEVVGQLVGEVEILLDQQDRHVAALAQEDDGAADVLDDRGLDAFGRLVEHQELGPHGERAADRELLLLAARQVAAAPAQHRLQHREELEHLVRDLLAGRGWQRREAGLEVLLHRQQREDLAALRHQRHAAPRALVGRQAA